MACCKWVWKNYRIEFHGQYKGKEKVIFVIIEEVVDDQLQCWHIFFGVAGCNNGLSLGSGIATAIDGCTLSTGFSKLIFAGWYQRKEENSMA